MDYEDLRLRSAIVLLLNKVDRIMVTQQQLSAKIDEVAEVLVTEIAQIKIALETKVPTEIDLSPEFAKLDTMQSAIEGIIPDEPVDDSEAPTEEDTPTE